MEQSRGRGSMSAGSVSRGGGSWPVRTCPDNVPAGAFES